MHISYFLLTTIIWFFCFAFYRWWLSGEKLPVANRFFLLASLIAGPLLPLLPRPELFTSVATSGLSPSLEAVQAFLIQLEMVTINGDGTSGWFAELAWYEWIWLAGSLLFLARMLQGWRHIYLLWKQGQKTKVDGVILVELPELSSPFSYGPLLFWCRGVDLHHPNWQAIWQHERAHIRQGHSYDLLVADLILLVFWWNPLPYFYRQALRLQHEYLADQAAAQIADPRDYARLLLQQHLGGWVPAPSHAFHNSFIKNRILMLTQPQGTSWKLLAILPLLLAIFWACEKEADLVGSNIAEAEEKMAQKQPTQTGDFIMVKDTTMTMDLKTYAETMHVEEVKVYKTVDQMPVFGNCQAELQSSNAEELSNCSNLNLLTMVYENIVYPASAKEAGLEGMVVAQFRVAAAGGKAIAPIIIKSSQPKDLVPTEKEAAGYAALDQAVLDMIGNLPADWKPGIHAGEAVNVQFNLPVKFKLE